MKTETDFYNKFCEENPKLFDATGLGLSDRANEFLTNRLYKAFMSGVCAGSTLEREAIKERICYLLFN